MKRCYINVARTANKQMVYDQPYDSLESKLLFKATSEHRCTTLYKDTYIRRKDTTHAFTRMHTSILCDQSNVGMCASVISDSLCAKMHISRHCISKQSVTQCNLD